MGKRHTIEQKTLEDYAARRYNAYMKGNISQKAIETFRCPAYSGLFGRKDGDIQNGTSRDKTSYEE